MQQWRWLVGITVLGMLISVAVALKIPKQYEVTTQVAVPDKADISAINVRGYGEWTTTSLFNKYYQTLSSSEELEAFIKEGAWLEKLFPESVNESSDSEMFAAVSEGFSLAVLSPLKAKGDANVLAPNLLGMSLWAKDEKVAVDLLNDYIVKTNVNLIASIKVNGQRNRDLEVEKIQANILLLRSNAKQIRLLAIQKLAEANEEEIKALSQSIALLTSKFDIDAASELVRLSEALSLAVSMKIKTPKTIESFAKSNSGTEISVTTNARKDLFLMGSDYLEGRIKNIELRKNKVLYIKEISELKRQIEETKNDVALAALKARKSDDPYIAELPALLKKLDKLENLTFDFAGSKLYRLDKKAAVDGKAEKPKRALIVAVGSVLAFFMAIFIALIMGAVKRRRELA
jgi:LPS O-antigen subunit length determinant protein (WzzB/FepE family)